MAPVICHRGHCYLVCPPWAGLVVPPGWGLVCVRISCNTSFPRRHCNQTSKSSKLNCEAPRVSFSVDRKPFEHLLGGFRFGDINTLVRFVQLPGIFAQGNCQ